MAVPETQLNAITQRYIVPKLHDAIFDSNPFLKRILASGSYISVPGGTTIDVPLNYAVASANGWFNASETLDTSDSENMTCAKYTWCQLYAGVTISDVEESQNGGAAGIIKLLASKMKIAEKTIKDTLGTGLYSDGTNTKSIVGLADLVAVNQTVGQISQTTNSWWQAKLDSTTTTLSLSAMNAVYEDASVDSEKPTVGLTTRSIYGYYYNLLTPVQRFMDDGTAKGGFSNLMFNGIPIISDSHCTSASLYFINEKHVGLYYHPDWDFRFQDFERPVNQQLRVGRFLWMGALGSSNNRLHGRLSAITA